MSKRIGFDLEGSHFYIHGSNITNVMSVGSTNDTTTLKLYANSDSNIAYHLGLDATDPPLFWIGRQVGSSPSSPYEPVINPALFIKNSKVGIQTPDPISTLDVRGDISLTGRIITSGSNSTIQSESINTSVISGLGSNNGIDFNNSKLYNIQSVNVSTDVTTGGVQRHIMNETQHLQALQSSGLISSVATNEMYMSLSWNSVSQFVMLDPMMQVELTFFGSGENDTRMHIRTSLLIHIPTASLDLVIDKTSFQSDNIVQLDTIVRPITPNLLHIGVKWQVSSYSKHNGYLKVQVMAPSELGDITVT